MALELLSGPHECAIPDLSGVTLSADSGAWVDGVGIVTSGSYTNEAGASANALFVMTPDGITYRRGVASGVVFMNELGKPGNLYGRSQSGDPATTMRSRFSLSPVGDFSASFYPLYGHAIRTADRWISIQTDHVVSTPLNSSGFSAWIFEDYYPIPMGLCRGISPYRHNLGQIALIGRTVSDQTAAAAIYDVNTRQWLGVKHFGVPSTLVVYAYELGVWLLVMNGTPTTISVFADTAVPTQISSPVAVTSVALGKTNHFRTRVTASYGEPVPNETIDWSASAGTMLDAQTTTDADGYATARYVAPLEAGAIDITAELVI